MNRNPLLRRFLQLREAIYKRYSQLHHVEFLEGPNILVLSPHPDDDVFGCGGTIILHLAQGHRVSIAYLTDGGRGIAGKNAVQTSAIRRQEAFCAAEILGIGKGDLYFMGQPDGQLSVTPANIKWLRDLLQRLCPDLIYLPSIVDNHPDHYQTNLLLKSALEQPVLLAAYEIWTPFIPNRLVDITTVMAQKQAAMQAHQSQLAALDYASAIMGLNSYRGRMYAKKPMEYAEAFLVVESSEYPWG
jgi:LmbE family N-acetylglucosaminyl deacetylase